MNTIKDRITAEGTLLFAGMSAITTLTAIILCIGCIIILPADTSAQISDTLPLISSQTPQNTNLDAVALICKLSLASAAALATSQAAACIIGWVKPEHALRKHWSELTIILLHTIFTITGCTYITLFANHYALLTLAPAALLSDINLITTTTIILSGISLFLLCMRDIITETRGKH